MIYLIIACFFLLLVIIIWLGLCFGLKKFKKGIDRKIVFIITVIISFIIITINHSLIAESCYSLNYLLFSEEAKYERFIKITNNTYEGRELLLLGTIHSNHLDSKGYSLGHIQAAIENLQPDLLLIEVRPNELDRGNLADGPIEMPFAYLIAQDNNIESKGIDYWDYELLSKGLKIGGKRDDIIYENIISSIEDVDYDKVLILIGYSHIPEQINRFKESGYNEVQFSKKEKEKLFDIQNVNFEISNEYIEYLNRWVLRFSQEELVEARQYPDVQEMIFQKKEGLIEIIKQLEKIK